jgi:hypothetical protein
LSTNKQHTHWRWREATMTQAGWRTPRGLCDDSSLRVRAREAARVAEKRAWGAGNSLSLGLRTTGRPPGPTRSHAPTTPPGASRSEPDSTNCLRPPAVPGTVSRHPGCRSDSRRPPTPHERTLHAGTGRARTPPRACGAGPGNRGFCICQPCTRDSGNKT